MAAESIDYERVIADLEAKRQTFNSAIDQAIAHIRTVLSMFSGLPAGVVLPPTATATVPASVAPATLTPDAFFGLSLAEAAIKYLRITKMGLIPTTLA